MSDLTDLTDNTDNTDNAPRYGLRARLTTPDYRDGLRKRRPDNNNNNSNSNTYTTNNQIIRGQDAGDSSNNSSSSSSSTGRRPITIIPLLTSSSKRMRQMQQHQKQQQPVSYLILEKIVNELTTDFESKLVELYHFLLDTNVSYLVLKELNFFEKLLSCLKNPKNQSIFTKVFIKPLNEVNMRKAPFKKIVITLLYFMEKKNYYDCIDLSEDVLDQQQINDYDGDDDDDDDASYTYSDILSSIYQHFRADGTEPPPFISQQSSNSLRPDLKTIVTGNIELKLKYQENKKLEITTKLFTRFRELANQIKLDDQNCLCDIGANILTRNNDIRNSRDLFTVHEQIDDDDDDDDDDDNDDDSEEIYNIHQLIQQQQLEQQHNNPQEQHEHDDEEDDGLNESLTNGQQNFGLEGSREEQEEEDDNEGDHEELNELFADQNRLELSGSQINTNDDNNNNNNNNSSSSNNNNNNNNNNNDNNNNENEDDEGEYTGDHEIENSNDNENGERSYDEVIEQERIGFGHADENGEYTDEEFDLIEHVEELFYSDRYGIEHENNIFYDETTEFHNHDDDATSTISSSSDGQHQSNDFFSYKETHWQFYIGDQRIPLDTTIYAAIHWYMMTNSKWNLNQQYEIELKYSNEPYTVDPNLPPTLDCKVIENNKSTLELLKLLHRLYVNMIEGENYQSNLFIFKNMDEVLNEKLKKPIAILTGVYPLWVYSVFHDYRFLVSGRNQLKLFKAQVFGIRMYNERDQDISGFSKWEFNIIKRLLPVWKDKEIQTREKVFDWALKQLEKTASLSHKIKIKFKGLGGVGLGVTRDFFTILSEEFFKKNKKMWINNSSVAYEGEYVQPYKSGLYPTLIGEDMREINENVDGDGFDEDNDTDNDGHSKLLNNFKLLGALTSVGLFNNCIVDLNMSKIFLTLLLKDLNENVKYDYGIDEIEGLYEPLVMQLKMINSTDEWPDFYIPSPPAFCEINFEEETDKTAANFQNIFIEYFFNKGVNRQINWYKTGFEHLFPFKYLKYLTPTPAEFTYFFCGRTKEDWKLDTLKKYIQKKNQSPISDRDYMMVLRIMSNLDMKDRKQLLRFATGSTRFPIGGWEVLGLNLDAFPTEEQHYYPVGRTCHNCIIVPPNNEEAELKRKLIYAINNQCEIDRD